MDNLAGPVFHAMHLNVGEPLRDMSLSSGPHVAKGYQESGLYFSRHACPAFPLPVTGSYVKHALAAQSNNRI